MTELEWLLLVVSLVVMAVPLTLAWCDADDDPQWVCEPDLRLIAALNRARQPEPVPAGPGRTRLGLVAGLKPTFAPG